VLEPNRKAMEDKDPSNLIYNTNINSRSNNLLKKIVTAVFFIFIGFSSLAQNRIQKITKSEKSVAKRMEQAEALLEKLALEKSDSLPIFYQDYAYWLFDHDVPKTIIYEKKALEEALSKSPIDEDFVQRSAMYLGFYYSINNQILESIKHYNQVLEYDRSSPHAKRAYAKLGLSYIQINDFPKALIYLELARTFYDKAIKLPNQRALREILQNLSYANRRIGSKESLLRGIRYGKSADSINDLIPTSPRIKFSGKFNLAELHNQNLSLDFEQSLRYFNEALEVASNTHDSVNIRNVHLGLGSLYNIFDTKSSLDALNKALQLTKKTDSFNLYQIHTSKGHTYALTKEFEKSLEQRHLGLKFLMGYNFDQHNDIPYKDLVETTYKTNLLHSIPQLAETYLAYYEENQDPQFLDNALRYFTMADQIIDLLRLNSDQFRSRLFWRRISTEIYGKAIRAAYLKNDPDQAFYFMEKDKALLLLEDITQNNYRKSLEFPKGHFKTEDSINQLLVLTEFRLKNAQQGKIDPSNLQQQVIDLNRELSKLTQDSNQLNANLDAAAVSSLKSSKKNLDDDELQMEYYISKDDGFGIYPNLNSYVLVYSRETVQLYEIPETKKLESQVTQLVELIRQPFQNEEAVQLYSDLAYQIYLELVPSEELRTRLKGKNITIIPDSFLSFLPFETLSNSKDEVRYLIQDSEFHYAYSRSFLDLTERSEHNPKFLGFAPIQFDTDQLGELEYSRNEIAMLQKNYRGDSFIELDATKEHFKNYLKDYGIVHLATHASAQDSIAPWIAFRDGKIYLDELYLLPNNASLVVLSGCDTSLGKEETGEGIMSLARGFFYSGASSVISTLWNIDDKSSSELISDFYSNLKDGQTKSKALHNAKINYLNTHNFTEASPHFWASYVLLGANDTIPSSSFPWWIIITSAIAIAGIFFLKKRKTTR